MRLLRAILAALVAFWLPTMFKPSGEEIVP